MITDPEDHILLILDQDGLGEETEEQRKEREATKAATDAPTSAEEKS